MNSKWKSSKKVPVVGIVFKRARLTAKSKSDDPKRGEYGHGSQEWLAEKARISLRTVSELEMGMATLKTVDAVSQILNIKGRKYIKGYGEDSTTIRTTGVVDFRPAINGRQEGNQTAYLKDAFLITLDPVVITVDDDFIDKVTLKRMTLKLSVSDMEIPFTWLYNVQLTGRSRTWLGDEEDVREIIIHTGKPYQSSVMFSQDLLNVISWQKFTSYISDSDDGRVLLTLTLNFEHFDKQDFIIVSVEELKSLLNYGFPKGCPYWAQPKALMI